jgi:hypothetical protein
MRSPTEARRGQFVRRDRMQVAWHRADSVHRCGFRDHARDSGSAATAPGEPIGQRRPDSLPQDPGAQSGTRMSASSDRSLTSSIGLAHMPWRTASLNAVGKLGSRSHQTSRAKPDASSTSSRTRDCPRILEPARGLRPQLPWLRRATRTDPGSSGIPLGRQRHRPRTLTTRGDRLLKGERPPHRP